jgi:hypothetical protein
MVASSSEDKGCIDLIIEPRDGFTRKLFDIAKDYQKDEKGSKEGDRPFGFAGDHPGKPEPSDFRTVILSGPHGRTYLLGNYSKVLMFAEGFGIAAVLQFLREVRTRHVYVRWQLKYLGKSCSAFKYLKTPDVVGDQHPATVLLDRALKEPALDTGYVSLPITSDNLTRLTFRYFAFQYISSTEIWISIDHLRTFLLISKKGLNLMLAAISPRTGNKDVGHIAANFADLTCTFGRAIISTCTL